MYGGAGTAGSLPYPCGIARLGPSVGPSVPGQVALRGGLSPAQPGPRVLTALDPPGHLPGLAHLPEGCCGGAQRVGTGHGRVGTHLPARRGGPCGAAGLQGSLHLSPGRRKA